MVVNTSELESQRDWLSKFLQKTSHICLNGIEALNLLIIIHEHIRVDLVDENFIPNVRFDLTRFLDYLEELLACTLVVGVMGINYIDECTAISDMLDRVTFEHIISWEIDNIEFYVVIVADSLRLNCSSWQQEEGLVRRHLLEDNL